MSSGLGARTRRPGTAAYTASKAAVSALTRAAAPDRIGEGVRIDAVSSGPSDSAMSLAPGESGEDRAERMERASPPGRVCSQGRWPRPSSTWPPTPPPAWSAPAWSSTAASRPERTGPDRRPGVRGAPPGAPVRGRPRVPAEPFSRRSPTAPPRPRSTAGRRGRPPAAARSRRQRR
ncbi:SDR family oxidoreductase [Streptomyces sulfonofaciens]|uniref:SDR family oxidoreductase n=1 Tax=Streptomyces sulfonofaciens TaxID=68272 RepID=UPI0035714890